MALKIDEIVAELRDLGFDPAKVTEAEKALRKLEEEKQEERKDNKTPQAKNQFVIVISDPENKLTLKDIVGYVLQVPENDDPNTAIDRLKRAAVKQNTTMKKFIKNPLKSFSDAAENVKRKFSKVENVLVKTPTPVIVLKTDNKL